MSFKQGVICYQVMFDDNGNPIEIKLTTNKDPKIHLDGYMGLHIDDELKLIYPVDAGDILNYMDSTDSFEKFKELVNNNTYTTII